ncbi:MAG: DciA family protein [Solirubrobacterales bacterium]
MIGRRAPRPLSAALPAVVGRVVPQTPLAAIQLAWPRAAGEAVAAESEPVSERSGVVTIACSSATWAEQLDLLQAELLERLRAEIGAAAEVSKLRFRVGETPTGPNRR